MNWRALVLIARKEVRDAVRNRWFLLYTASFAGLALALSRLSLEGGTAVGFAGYGRTAASLVNLMLLIVPLMGLTLGAASLAGERERGTMTLLLAQPITYTEILLGKFLGIALALTATLAAGFGLAAAVIAADSRANDPAPFVALVAFGVLLGLAMLSVGLLISAASGRTGSATATALFAWLVFVFVGDLGLMGTSAVMRMDIRTLFTLAVANPVESTKIAAIHTITGTLDVLGPAGVYAVRAYGDGLVPLLAAVVLAWAVAPLVLARLALGRVDS